MKYQWEIQDLNSGRKVESSNRSERYIIGYDASKSGDEPRLALVSLSDGMIARKDLTSEQMVQHLNASSMRPVEVQEGDHKPGKGQS